LKATVEWENEFLRFSFEGTWDWDDFYQSIERGRALDRKHTANVILDFRGVSHISPDAVLHLKRAAQIAEQNKRRYIVVAKTSSIQTIFMLFTRIYSSLAPRFFLVNSLDDAFALLAKPERTGLFHPETA
jgi:hypothetical protein